MVAVDLSIDSAGGAAQRCAIWKKHKVQSLRWDADDVGVIAKEKVEEFNEKARGARLKSPVTGPVALQEWLMEAAEDTVMKRCLQEYPKKARELHKYNSDDWKTRTALKRIRGVLRALSEWPDAKTREVRKMKHPLARIERVKEGPTLWKLYAGTEQLSGDDTREILQERVQEAVEYLAKANRAERQASIQGNKKRMTDEDTQMLSHNAHAYRERWSEAW